MKPAFIQAELKSRGITQKDLARDNGVCEMTVSQVVNKKGVSNRLMHIIAAKIEKPVMLVFPEYFNLTPKRRRKAA